MKIENHLYHVSLDIEECRLLSTALHAMYKNLKDAESMTPALSEKVTTVKSLRNNFAGLCGVSYMGADA